MAGETIDSIAAEVNGEIILLSEVKERQFQMRTMGADRSRTEKEALRSALESLIEEKLVVQFGREREEYKVTEMEIDQTVADSRKRAESQGAIFEELLGNAGLTMARYREMLKDQILARKVITREVRGQVNIGEEAAREYYESNRDLFMGRPSVRVSHILRYVPKDSPDEAWKKALEDITLLREKISGGAVFEDVAREFSDDPSRDSGGDLGEVVKGDTVPEFEDVAFSLEPGKVSQPVRSPFGYHLILVKSKVSPAMTPFEKARGEIENRLASEQAASARESWLRQVKKDAFVDIKYTF